MDLSLFTVDSPGSLVPISDTDPTHGPWSHQAFVPGPLFTVRPEFRSETWLAVSDAHAALAALDATARQLPEPRLLRRPSLQTEAQSTSALEGTYAPLRAVLTADDEASDNDADTREVINYVRMANDAFLSLEMGRPLGVSLVEQMQATLVAGTASGGRSAGAIRDHQVVVGRQRDAPRTLLPVKAARYVPPPPGLDLRAQLQELLSWMGQDHSATFGPVISAAMAHYQFEALHPFNDGNGRIGRLLIVAHLLAQGTLVEPTLTVSPWFEARRESYYDHLLGVSTRGDWDGYVRFFARGLADSAKQTHATMLKLVGVQASLRETVRNSSLRADNARALVDYAVGHPAFTVRAIQRHLDVGFGRANTLIGQLADLGILAQLDPEVTRNRRFYSPDVLDVLLNAYV